MTVAVVRAVAPVTAWDGLAYHLTGPELYQAAGRITQPIDLPHFGFPQFGEMLFLQLQLLGGHTPSVLHWLFAVLTTMLVAGEARRLWHEPIGWAAAAIFLSAETVILEAGYQAARQLALNRFTTEDEQALRQLRQEQLDLLADFGGAYQLYRLRK